MRVHGQRSDTSYSQHDTLKLGSFVRAIALVHDSCSPDTSVNDRLQQLRAIESDNFGIPWESAVYCRACKTKVKQDIATITNRAEQAVKGLCLDCLRFPDKFDGGNCRVKH